MKRETLVENVKTVIRRAKSKPLPLNVSEVGLFGSLLFGKENPGDADLYIEFEGTTRKGEIWDQKLREFGDYLFDLSRDYKSTKQFIDDNFNSLRKRGLKPEWIRFAPLRNIRGKDRHGMTFGQPIISSKQIAKRILRKGCGGINFQRPPSNASSVVLFDGKKCYPERINPGGNKLNKLFEKERKNLRGELSAHSRGPYVTRMEEQIGYVGEMDPNCELWEVVSNAISDLKTEVIDQSGPYLVRRYGGGGRKNLGGKPKIQARGLGRLQN